MMKTKIVGKKPIKKGPPQGDKKIIEKNLFEAKALKKGQYRDENNPLYIEGEEEPGKPFPKGEVNVRWWHDMKDGESCRTFDSNKVHSAIAMSINEGKGLLIEGVPDGKYYAWYMTRLLTKRNSIKPSEQGPIPEDGTPKQKGKRK